MSNDSKMGAWETWAWAMVGIAADGGACSAATLRDIVRCALAVAAGDDSQSLADWRERSAERARHAALAVSAGEYAAARTVAA